MSAEKDGFARFIKRFPKGTVLFNEGDEGEEMYILRSGKVAIKKRVPHGEIVVAMLEKGDFFGEMAMLERNPRTAGAEMAEDGDLIVIGSDQQMFKELSNIHTLIKLREMDEEQIMQDMMPVGFILDGVSEHEEAIPEKNWVWKEVKKPQWDW